MAKPKLPIPVTLLTGYLGSGKTTLINHVLSNQEGYKCAVIVNDIGEVNIDAELIQKAGVVTQKDDNLVPLSNGCICCTLKVDLINQIAELVKSGKFDYILIEASGICEPLPIAQSIAVLEGDEEEGTPAICRLDNIVTVVDALRMATEFGCGDNLLKDDVDEEDIESLVIQQIEFCSTIILNKVDMVNEEQLGRVKAMIRTLQPKAKIIEANYGKVSVGDILNTNLYDFEETAGSAGWAQAYDKDEDEKNEHHDHDHDEDEHEHHHHDEDEHEHHHHDKDEHEHHHHHDHDEDHDHEHHHEHDENCTCGCHDHDHDHHHHHHHADEVFTSWGIETPNTYSAEDIEKILTALDSGEYGAILRAKGMVPAPDGTWVYYDYVPEEHDIRSGKPEVTGKICVIGSKLDEDKLAELFRK